MKKVKIDTAKQMKNPSITIGRLVCEVTFTFHIVNQSAFMNLDIVMNNQSEFDLKT